MIRKKGGLFWRWLFHLSPPPLSWRVKCGSAIEYQKSIWVVVRCSFTDWPLWLTSQAPRWNSLRKDGIDAQDQQTSWPPLPTKPRSSVTATAETTQQMQTLVFNFSFFFDFISEITLDDWWTFFSFLSAVVTFYLPSGTAMLTLAASWWPTQRGLRPWFGIVECSLPTCLRIWTRSKLTWPRVLIMLGLDERTCTAGIDDIGHALSRWWCRCTCSSSNSSIPRYGSSLASLVLSPGTSARARVPQGQRDSQQRLSVCAWSVICPRQPLRVRGKLLTPTRQRGNIPHISGGPADRSTGAAGDQQKAGNCRLGLYWGMIDGFWAEWLFAGAASFYSSDLLPCLASMYLPMCPCTHVPRGWLGYLPADWQCFGPCADGETYGETWVWSTFGKYSSMHCCINVMYTSSA